MTSILHNNSDDRDCSSQSSRNKIEVTWNSCFLSNWIYEFVQQMFLHNFFFVLCNYFRRKWFRFQHNMSRFKALPSSAADIPSLSLTKEVCNTLSTSGKHAGLGYITDSLNALALSVCADSLPCSDQSGSCLQLSPGPTELPVTLTRLSK